jgi:membrane protein involved in colicin uptake
LAIIDRDNTNDITDKLKSIFTTLQTFTNDI